MNAVQLKKLNLKPLHLNQSRLPIKSLHHKLLITFIEKLQNKYILNPCQVSTIALSHTQTNLHFSFTKPHVIMLKLLTFEQNGAPSNNS